MHACARANTDIANLPLTFSFSSGSPSPSLGSASGRASTAAIGTDSSEGVLSAACRSLQAHACMCVCLKVATHKQGLVYIIAALSNGGV
eukprot:447481-Pelagomonas_calceolata.AAC.10